MGINLENERRRHVGDGNIPLFKYFSAKKRSAESKADEIYLRCFRFVSFADILKPMRKHCGFPKLMMTC